MLIRRFQPLLKTPNVHDPGRIPARHTTGTRAEREWYGRDYTAWFPYRGV